MDGAVGTEFARYQASAKSVPRDDCSSRREIGAPLRWDANAVTWRPPWAGIPAEQPASRSAPHAQMARILCRRMWFPAFHGMIYANRKRAPFCKQDFPARARRRG